MFYSCGVESALWQQNRLRTHANCRVCLDTTTFNLALEEATFSCVSWSVQNVTWKKHSLYLKGFFFCGRVYQSFPFDASTSVCQTSQAAKGKFLRGLKLALWESNFDIRLIFVSVYEDTYTSLATLYFQKQVSAFPKMFLLKKTILILRLDWAVDVFRLQQFQIMPHWL